MMNDNRVRALITGLLVASVYPELCRQVEELKPEESGDETKDKKRLDDFEAYAIDMIGHCVISARNIADSIIEACGQPVADSPEKPDGPESQPGGPASGNVATND